MDVCGQLYFCVKSWKPPKSEAEDEACEEYEYEHNFPSASVIPVNLSNHLIKSIPYMKKEVLQYAFMFVQQL